MYTKSTKLLDCALIGACAVIRSITVVPDKRRIHINSFLISPQKHVTQEPLYKTVRYKTVSNIRWLKVDPKIVISKQKCIDYIEKLPLWSFFYIILTFLFGLNLTKMCRLYMKMTIFV